MSKKPILIAICTVGAVWALVRYMRIDSFPFAWALNFLLMLGVFAFTEALKGQLTSSYYGEKAWERRGKIYEFLGINYFRKFLVLIGWEKVTKKSAPVEKSAEALGNLLYQTKKAELGHLIVLIIVLGFTLFVAVKFGIRASAWLLVLNILLNLFPVLLQRYNRPRIERAISLNKRTSNRARFPMPDSHSKTSG